MTGTVVPIWPPIGCHTLMSSNKINAKLAASLSSRRKADLRIKTVGREKLVPPWVKFFLNLSQEWTWRDSSAELHVLHGVHDVKLVHATLTSLLRRSKVQSVQSKITRQTLLPCPCCNWKWLSGAIAPIGGASSMGHLGQRDMECPAMWITWEGTHCIDQWHSMAFNIEIYWAWWFFMICPDRQWPGFRPAWALVQSNFRWMTAMCRDKRHESVAK